ncbi:MAG: RNA methyltransferase [Selenomonadaceae bacterium]|nr:RNA methyltransferase [Selenomonadaceae bacterium]
MQKIANTKTPQGVLLVIKQKNFTLNDIKSENFIVALDEVKDPGNVGAIIRLSDAVGAGAVALSVNSADAYSDKAVRASMGSVFNIPVLQNIDKQKLIDFAKEQNLKIYATKMNATSCYDKDLKGAGIFVFGSESDGVSDEILNAAENISLPMRGKAESLNVATAASALLYEVFRQSLKPREQ